MVESVSALQLLSMVKNVSAVTVKRNQITQH
jgi:hypothetical protein